MKTKKKVVKKTTRSVKTTEKKTELKERLLDVVVNEIKKDFWMEDLESLYELLRYTPLKNLIAYIRDEEQWKEFEGLKRKPKTKK
jgi:hypothetical protein